LLEDEFGTDFFIRTRKGLELTEAGKALQSLIVPYLDQHDKIVSVINQIKGKNKSSVSIGMTNEKYDFVFPSDFFLTFMKQNPDINLNIMSFSDVVCQKSILEYSLNFGFAHGPIGFIDTNAFESFLCKKNKMILLVGQKHRLANRTSVKLHELKGEQAIVFNNDRFLVDACHKGKIDIGIHLSASEFAFANELCKSNHYICFGERSQDKQHELAGMEIEDMELYLETYLVINKSVFLTEGAKKFVEYTKKTFIRSGQAGDGTS
jgi:DNA-binding transcriptional LysR family regulator